MAVKISVTRLTVQHLSVAQLMGGVLVDSVFVVSTMFVRSHTSLWADWHKPQSQKLEKSILLGHVHPSGQTDINHNHKHLKYQVFTGGSCCATIGSFIFDQGLLPISGIPLELNWSGDFASDLLLLAWHPSYDRVEKLSALVDSEDVSLVAVLCFAIIFSRLNLYAVNWKSNIYAQTRIFSCRLFLLWKTIIHGISIITKRNYLYACLVYIPCNAWGRQALLVGTINSSLVVITAYGDFKGTAGLLSLHPTAGNTRNRGMNSRSTKGFPSRYPWTHPTATS